MKLFLIRVRFLTRRVLRWSPARLKFFIDLTRKTSSRPRWLLGLDMIWCAFRYEAPFESYPQWDFNLLTAKQRATFMTNAKSSYLSNRFNSQQHRHLMDDKRDFDALFAQYLGREWMDLDRATPEEFDAFLHRTDRIFAKIVTGDSGKGIAIVDTKDVTDPRALYDQLLADRQVVVEQALPQHPEMSRLNASSVNTLRIVTYRDPDDEVWILARCLKIGNGAPIDNYHGGGMYTMMDEHGKVLHAASNFLNDIFEVHPISGVTITGFQVPMFDEVIALAKELAMVVPEMPYIGWDLAVSPTGPAVIEGNHNSGVFQSRPAVSGIMEGTLPLFRQAMRF